MGYLASGNVKNPISIFVISLLLTVPTFWVGSVPYRELPSTQTLLQGACPQWDTKHGESRMGVGGCRGGERGSLALFP